MDTHPLHTDSGNQEEMPGQSMLDSVLVSIRVIACGGALLAIIYGVILAIQLFGLFRGIVENPAETIASWQQAVAQAQPEITETLPATVVDTPVPTAPDSSEGVEETTPAIDPSEAIAPTPPVTKATPRVDDSPDFIQFADHVLNRLEMGQYSWLIALGILVIFCWLLVKIPGMLITLGTQLLLGLVNVKTE